MYKAEYVRWEIFLGRAWEKNLTVWNSGSFVL